MQKRPPDPAAIDAVEAMTPLQDFAMGRGFRLVADREPPLYAAAMAVLGDTFPPGVLDAAFTDLERMQTFALEQGFPNPGVDLVAQLRVFVQAAVTSAHETHPLPMIRGSRRSPLTQEYDTTVLLMKAAQKPYLTGFLVVDGVKRQVVAHINNRKPDPQTGVRKPNFLVISELISRDGDADSWKEIGFGNALNRRSDGKPLFYDEFLFSVEGHSIGARITSNVDPALHSMLGFEHARKERPEHNSAPATNNKSTPTPKLGAA